MAVHLEGLGAAKWATAGGAGGLDIGVLTFQEILSLLDWEEDQQWEDEVAAVAVYHVIGWQLQGHQTDHREVDFQNLSLIREIYVKTCDYYAVPGQPSFGQKCLNFRANNV